MVLRTNEEILFYDYFNNENMFAQFRYLDISSNYEITIFIIKNWSFVLKAILELKQKKKKIFQIFYKKKTNFNLYQS